MILVTGGTGFIGSHLVDRLVSQGKIVRCLVRRSSPARRLVNVDLAYGDLARGEGLEAALEDVDCVIHLAGVTKALRPADYYAGNARATVNLVGAMEGHRARLVHVSSLAAAGPSPDGLPLDEDAVPAPFTHYGKSKLEAEQAACRRAGTVVVRPPVVYGPRDTDVFQLLKSINRQLVLEIGGGERWFSAIYVKDLVDGILTAAGSPAAAGRIYYLTYPEPYTWSELALAAAAIMQRRPRLVRVPYGLARTFGLAAELWARLRGKPGIVSREKVAEACCPHWTCSSQRASRELGFTARTSLQLGLAQTLAWYKEAGWLSY